MLKGKSVVITGSTSGIGLGMARSFAAEGANIMLNGLGDPAGIEELRSGVEADFKVKAVYSAADMTRPAEIIDMIGQAQRELGGVDVLVNNAGIQHVAPVDKFPPEK
jgi:3-hydroxybutyrate dehydrogenase